MSEGLSLILPLVIECIQQKHGDVVVVEKTPGYTIHTLIITGNTVTAVKATINNISAGETAFDGSQPSLINRFLRELRMFLKVSFLKYQIRKMTISYLIGKAPVKE